MKIKELLSFYAFQGADFVDYVTHEYIYDIEKEIEDIHSIQINEKVEYIGTDYKYAALRHWLTVNLIVKEGTK